jgi:hypothetical protein
MMMDTPIAIPPHFTRIPSPLPHAMKHQAARGCSARAYEGNRSTVKVISSRVRAQIIFSAPHRGFATPPDTSRTRFCGIFGEALLSGVLDIGLPLREPLTPGASLLTAITPSHHRHYAPQIISRAARMPRQLALRDGEVTSRRERRSEFRDARYRAFAIEPHTLLILMPSLASISTRAARPPFIMLFEFVYAAVFAIGQSAR